MENIMCETFTVPEHQNRAVEAAKNANDGMPAAVAGNGYSGSCSVMTW